MGKLLSALFLSLGIILMAVVTYVLISYASAVLGSIVQFVSTNDYAKLQQCGVQSPPEFGRIQADFASFILPMLYAGIPFSLVVLSVLMFLSGMYYGKSGVHHREAEHENEFQREHARLHREYERMHRAQKRKENPRRHARK